MELQPGLKVTGSGKFGPPSVAKLMKIFMYGTLD